MRPKRAAATVIMMVLLGVPVTQGSTDDGPTVEQWEQRLNQRQPPLEVLDAIDVRPGMVIGEVGAGRGRMTVWLAWRVGESGKVFANDIDTEALRHLETRCRAEGISQIETVVGGESDPRLPEAALDMAFMINVFHHLDEPAPLLRHLIPSLKKGGVLAIVECNPTKTDWGADHNCTSPTEMAEHLAAAGFELTSTDERLSEDTIYLAEVRHSR